MYTFIQCAQLMDAVHVESILFRQWLSQMHILHTRKWMVNTYANDVSATASQV